MSDLSQEFARAAAELAGDLGQRPDVQAEIESSCFSRAAWGAAGEGGWFLVLVPEELGGLGLGLRELSGVFSAVGRYLLPGPFYEQAVAAPLVLTHSPHLEELLDPVCRGERVVAVVDPEAVRNSFGIQPDITYSNGSVSGTLDLVRFAQIADVLIVVACDQDHGDVVALCPANGLGCEIEPLESLDPTTAYATVHLENAPAELVQGEGGLAETIRASIRMMIASELEGAAAKVMEMSVEYAKLREQFGRPIGGFQALAHLLADAHVQLVSLSAHGRDALPPAGVAPLADEASMVKAHASRAAREICEVALQVHGGIGFTVEHPLHRYYKHALALQGAYGDHSDLALEIGRKLVCDQSLVAQSDG